MGLLGTFSSALEGAAAHPLEALPRPQASGSPFLQRQHGWMTIHASSSALLAMRHLIAMLIQNVH